MTAEKFIAAWFRSTFLIPKVLTFGNSNYYYAMVKGNSEGRVKRKNRQT